MLGRAPLHGTASAGEAGALRALQIFRDEIDRVLALIGCPSIADLSPDYVIMPSTDQRRSRQAVSSPLRGRINGE